MNRVLLNGNSYALWVLFLVVSCAGPVWAPSASAQTSRANLADLREDVNLLSQQVARLRMEVEDLKRENARLREDLSKRDSKLESMERSVSETSRSLRSRVSEAQSEAEQAERRLRRDIIAEVTKQIEALASQTQKALEDVSRGGRTPATQTPAFEFSDDYPRTGVAYEVRPGDTISGIAQKHASTVRDIQNANRIADPRQLRVGQTIFVPQRQ